MALSLKKVFSRCTNKQFDTKRSDEIEIVSLLLLKAHQ